VVHCATSSSNGLGRNSKVYCTNFRSTGCFSCGPRKSQRHKLDVKLTCQLWVFTPRLVFSTNVYPERLGPTRAMKILWKIGGDDPVVKNHRAQPAVETISLQQKDFDRIKEALTAGKSLLPASMKEFNSWNVSNLETFMLNDLAL
jgi:HECT-like Ubiquitin-conjugating enzyme (E2)-binding